VRWGRRRRACAWDILAVGRLVAGRDLEHRSAYWRGGGGVGGHGMRRNGRSCWRIYPEPTHVDWLYVYKGFVK
jgi:hypothetical protein